MLIEWVNHASFIVESGPVRLISDPWLEGTAFNNGWNLLTPTKLAYDDFASITHIWFSHEHPDHFSPPNLKKIPEEFRSRITVLFHETRDKRVARLCRSLNFQVQELPNAVPVELSRGFRILCGTSGLLDSWVALFCEGKTLLNMNDCVFTRQQELSSIERKVGKVDVLLSQFSYANWVGNPGDHETQKKHALRKFSEMAKQIAAFRPAQFIPFASFIYFCHDENFFMNQNVNRIADTYRFTSHDLETDTVILYPGDRWEVGTALAPGEAIRKYEEDFDRALKSVPVTSPEIDYRKLKLAANALVSKCIKANSPIFLRAMAPAVVHLSDLKKDVELAFRYGLREAQGKQPDIIMSSDSLFYCMKTDWGGETLEINGRFQVPRGGHSRRFFQFFRVPQYNSYGSSLNLKFMGGRIIERTRNALSV
jgi:UDP-MurNAc hydroxylase